tara:strand:+ start:117 stop:389 length:273 start_codon:yes stop_codon:yes gene_type:complete
MTEKYLLNKKEIENIIFDYCYQSIDADENEQIEFSQIYKKWFKNYKTNLKNKSTNNINYEKAYNVLIDYFDYIPEEEKENLDKQLKELGL